MVGAGGEGREESAVFIVRVSISMIISSLSHSTTCSRSPEATVVNDSKAILKCILSSSSSSAASKSKQREAASSRERREGEPRTVRRQILERSHACIK